MYKLSLLDIFNGIAFLSQWHLNERQEGWLHISHLPSSLTRSGSGILVPWTLFSRYLLSICKVFFIFWLFLEITSSGVELSLRSGILSERLSIDLNALSNSEVGTCVHHSVASLRAFVESFREQVSRFFLPKAHFLNISKIKLSSATFLS